MAKKTFTQKQIDELAEEYLDCQAQQEKLRDKMDSIKAELEEAIISRNQDTISTRKHIIKYVVYNSNRFDSTRFKAELPDMYNQYQKVTTCHKWDVK